MLTTCLTPTAEVSDVDLVGSTSDLTTIYTSRYRLESDPDADASYTAVTTTKTTMGITYNYFDITTVDPATYVLHTYLTTDGSATGTKVTIDVACQDEV